MKILAARAAASARKWHEAAASFAEADAADELLAADLEQWALAIECCGRPRDAVPPLTRAVAAYGMAGQRLRAAHPAVALARIHLERGELAVAKGWHTRAAALIGAANTSREYGLWCWMGSRVAAAEGEPERALVLAEQAYAVGRDLEDPVVESLGLVYRGFFKLCLGETGSGLEDQDFAAALGLSSDIDPVVGGILYCNILWACRNFGDWTRADQWTLGYERWCSACGLEDLTGSCRLHRAEVLGVQGTLKQAEKMVRDALDQLATDAPWATGDALRVLGDIHLAAGDLAEAEAAYRAGPCGGLGSAAGLCTPAAQARTGRSRFSWPRTLPARDRLAGLAAPWAASGHFGKGGGADGASRASEGDYRRAGDAATPLADGVNPGTDGRSQGGAFHWGRSSGRGSARAANCVFALERDRLGNQCRRRRAVARDAARPAGRRYWRGVGTRHGPVHRQEGRFTASPAARRRVEGATWRKEGDEAMTS